VSKFELLFKTERKTKQSDSANHKNFATSNIPQIERH
jgi:hypothetical protein